LPARYFTVAKLLAGCGWDFDMVPMMRRVAANGPRVKILREIAHRRVLTRRRHG